MAGRVSTSRSAGQALGAAVVSMPRSQGAIQQMVARGSEAMVPHDDGIGQMARSAVVHHRDATSWLTQGDRQGLWVMTHSLGASFQRHPTRSQTAFAQLIADWRGLLVSADDGGDGSWQGRRQTC